MKYVVKREDEVLDEIVYKAYGSVFGYLEMVLDANIFLYKQPIILKQGIEIELPELKKASQNRVTLWN